MVAQFLREIEPSLSPARLQRYQGASRDPLDMVVNYVWNMALCEALYCSLNAVEIALRNGLHRTLTQHFGTPNWYDRRGILEPYQRKHIADAKKTILSYGDPVTADRVVSQVPFGFWVTILSRNYDARLWSMRNAAPIKSTFLRIPRKDRQRVTIHAQYNAIRELRNRVMHHEPLFDDPILRQRHGEVYRALHWLNPRMVDLIAWYDRFDDVYRDGRARVEQTLNDKLGIVRR